MHFKMFTKCKVLHPMLCSQSVSVLFVMYAHLSMCKYYRNDGDGSGGKYLSFAYRYQKKYHMEFNINSLWTIQIKRKQKLEKKIDQYILPCINIRIGYFQHSTFNFSTQSAISSLRFFFTLVNVSWDKSVYVFIIIF